jgi:predicted DNA-binding transcriptional regulator YafY
LSQADKCEYRGKIMRADRLLSMMMMLQARGRMTAQSLAQQLEVSERTIYRDVDALSIAGVPVYTQPGTDGGIFLDENYRISLTGLSISEVKSLFLANASQPLTDLGLGGAVEDTLLKLFATLPTRQRQEAQRMQERFYIDTANWFQMVEPQPFLPLLEQAIWEDRTIRVDYQAVEGQVEERILEAYALVAKVNIWYLVAKKESGEMRNYRLSRLYKVDIMERHFERDKDFDLANYWKISCIQFEEVMKSQMPPFYVTIRVHPDMFWYFPSWMASRYQQLGKDETGWEQLRITFESLDDAVIRLTGLGTQIEILEPEGLKQDLMATAQAVLNFYAT